MTKGRKRKRHASDLEMLKLLASGTTLLTSEIRTAPLADEPKPPPRQEKTQEPDLVSGEEAK